MGKYTKNTSTYILRKRSQGVNGGAIFERDWTTLGERLRFGDGKTPVYNDGNFIFTRSNMRTPSRKNKNTEDVVTLNYDDVKDAKAAVNNVELNTSSNDIRSYAYYGSCVELVESSISHIIAWFPACIYSTTEQLDYPVYNELTGELEGYENMKKDNQELYKLANPFLIDLTSDFVNLGEYDNPMRFFYLSYEKYSIYKGNDTEGKQIKSYEISFDIDTECPSNDLWYIKQDPIVIIDFKTEDDSIYTVYGYKLADDIVFLSKETDITIKPDKEIIEEYFDNLKGFERQLLNRRNKPLYSNTFITPVEGKLSYKYVKRNYRWPTVNDYCIDIASGGYANFVSKLLDMANIYDELWTNNLYGRMTHEAIKNFDWTYTRDYIDGEEQDNIDGGQRMQKMIYLMGRLFDEQKQYIDGIKSSNVVTYDNFGNLPDALLSDKLELNGWDVTSTIPSFLADDKENNGYVKLTDDFINENINIGNNDKPKWFSGLNVEGIDTTTMDISFMKRLLLSSKRIFMSKGTQESIDMVMGMFGLGRSDENNGENNDYNLYETYYEAEAKEDDDGRLEDTFNNINITRSMTLEDSESSFAGLPIEKIIHNNKSFIIPFYNKDKDYGHTLYFQSKGGWGHLGETSLTNENQRFGKYCETISYLNVVLTVGDLLNVSSMTSNKGDIYYVVDLSEYATTFTEDDGINKASHFFVLMNDYLPSQKGSWRNIHTGSFDSEDVDNLTQEEYDYYSAKAKYLDSVVNNTLGNNPHCGYGYYDNGQEFIAYLSNPFKYFEDNGEVVIDEESQKGDVTFSISDPQKVTDDVNRKLSRTMVYGDEGDGGYTVRLNSKVLFFENKHNNAYYKRYFLETILPYVMQVIPSTTILILEGF